MRQWELAGITDTDVVLVPPSEDVGVGSWTFLWSTDDFLRVRTLGEDAAILGLPECEGEDLAAVFEREDGGAAVMVAYRSALEGRESRFTLHGVPCRVAPTHAGDGRVIGTVCLAGS